MKITVPIMAIKGKTARSKIDVKNGKPATSILLPCKIEGNKSKIKIIIENGRTHQIRVHCQAVNFPIIGDRMYGKKVQQVNRMLLHSKVTRIFHYEFIAEEPKEFYAFGF